ncbi:amino acid/amide ABC transporter ATP-binding protein 2 (HAAT family) [Actinomycetospora succinea]|uniref:Amino acid/amide ABC transporter ATP-binding protein 2 (HAAT family) n=1 Tax=Actinomycetospora succinea TaxID=663603 RepID=A0A4R6US19_9PSEU|nr:ABC transporter ATP-binding protein [Actinomycetospora succinea]TDQ50128.1 amino acid/amide ABC transporter ATP-binding protein 2 (HAAT family) [Actinomycetospora succinea]
MSLLELDDVHVAYGRIQALRGVSLRVEQGQIVALIGANGAGKTTTMKAISGILGLQSGSMRFDGEDLAPIRADLRVGKGISQVPEGRGIFPGMTVAENIDMGAYLRNDRRTPEFAADLERVYEIFPRLAERRSQAGGTLSGGEQQMLAMGRALMARPRLLLLDEPSMGLAPQFIAQIFRVITEINAEGTTVLLVEQNATQALGLAHQAYVLETGEVTRSGTGAELLADPTIQDAYLGVS